MEAKIEELTKVINELKEAQKGISDLLENVIVSTNENGASIKEFCSAITSTKKKASTSDVKKVASGSDIKKKPTLLAYLKEQLGSNKESCAAFIEQFTSNYGGAGSGSLVAELEKISLNVKGKRTTAIGLIHGALKKEPKGQSGFEVYDEAVRKYHEKYENGEEVAAPAKASQSKKVVNLAPAEVGSEGESE